MTCPNLRLFWGLGGHQLYVGRSPQCSVSARAEIVHVGDVLLKIFVVMSADRRTTLVLLYRCAHTKWPVRRSLIEKLTWRGARSSERSPIILWALLSPIMYCAPTPCRVWEKGEKMAGIKLCRKCSTMNVSAECPQPSKRRNFFFFFLHAEIIKAFSFKGKQQARRNISQIIYQYQQPLLFVGPVGRYLSNFSGDL